jgi:tetratricopeptide (TPR) repeat protein
MAESFESFKEEGGAVAEDDKTKLDGLTEQDQTKQATILKDEGNQFFSHGKFEEAETCYTKAIALDPSLDAIWSNRAAARLKLLRPVVSGY